LAGFMDFFSRFQTNGCFVSLTRMVRRAFVKSSLAPKRRIRQKRD
jgi:hypothetical protein